VYAREYLNLLISVASTASRRIYIHIRGYACAYSSLWHRRHWRHWWIWWSYMLA